MRQQLRAYRNGQVDLAGLISNWESLYGCLPNMPQAWRDEFWDHWSTLEIVYSVAVVNGQPVESPESKEPISHAIAAVEKLIVGALP